MPEKITRWFLTKSRFIYQQLRDLAILDFEAGLYEKAAEGFTRALKPGS